MNAKPPHPLAIQLERLRRHYEDAVRTYDRVTFLDLSHSLRYWEEVSLRAAEYEGHLATTRAFETAVPIKRVRKAIRTAEYVMTYMPHGVRTFARGDLGWKMPGRYGHEVSYCGSVMYRSDGGVEFGILGNVIWPPAGREPDGIREQLWKSEVTKVNFRDWWAAECVRLRWTGPEPNLGDVKITRAILAKRVANTMDASHPAGGKPDGDGNQFDVPVHWLMKCFWGGIPLPYFVLLKIAQDILDRVPPLIGLDPTAAA